MKAKINNGQLEYFKQPVWLLGDATAYAQANGFMEVEYPTLTETQLLGNPKVENGVITFEVTEKSVEQLTAEKLSEAKMQQAEAFREYQTKQAQQEVQTLDDVSALENKAIYPFWEVGLSVKVDEKYQHFNAENEVVLWKVIQAHTTQSDWRPKDTPALWLRVGFDGEILDWVQPTGAHDAYNIGEKVRYEGSIWESNVNSNIYAPGVVQGQWIKLYDL